MTEEELIAEINILCYRFNKNGKQMTFTRTNDWNEIHIHLSNGSDFTHASQYLEVILDIARTMMDVYGNVQY